MIEGKTVLADFQFIGHRVSKFVLETKLLDTKGKKVDISFYFDYNVIDIREEDNKHFGIIEFFVSGKAKVRRKLLFKLDVSLEGAFLGVINTMPKDKFKDMLEINGVVTLSQITRSFLLSVTSQSGINPPVRLPMINVMALREKKRQQGDNKG